MKVLRIISIVVVMVGLFTWFLAPFVANFTFKSSDGVPASAITLNNEPASLFLVPMWKVQSLHWMPAVSAILLIASLLCVFFNEYRGVGACSIAAIAALIIGGKQLHDALGVPALSIGYLLLLYCFAALLGTSIVALTKAKNVLRASGIMFTAWGIVLWLTAPFLSGVMFHNILDGRSAISSAALLSDNSQQYFVSLKAAWETTPIFWVSLATVLLLGACLVLAILKRSQWSFTCAFAGIAALIGGGIFVSVTMPLKKAYLHLGLGFFLLIGVFALLAFLSITELLDIKNKAKAELPNE